MADPKMIAENYLAAWNAPGEKEREIQMMKWAQDARYVDPLMQGDGREGIAAMIATALTRFPGHSFTLTGMPDGYGDHVRFSWSLGTDGGTPVARGTDFVRLDREGRITDVIGFLDTGAA